MIQNLDTEYPNYPMNLKLNYYHDMCKTPVQTDTHQIMCNIYGPSDQTPQECCNLFMKTNYNKTYEFDTCYTYVINRNYSHMLIECNVPLYKDSSMIMIIIFSSIIFTLLLTILSIYYSESCNSCKPNKNKLYRNINVRYGTLNNEYVL
jgi:hypothetical protein